tara:strand:+ start:2320 stop:2883 length:564 start_codon:yes stop_codon:yes gene_type:complete
MDIKNLLNIRKRIKAKKPEFVRQDSHKKPSLKKKWIRPKGLQSKLRLKRRGKARVISSGYRSPRKVRGLHKSGLEEKRITSIKNLEGLNSEKHILVISSLLGKKKKLIILKKVKELGLKVSNLNCDEFIKKAELEIESKKKISEKKKKDVKVKVEKKKEKLADKVSKEDGEEVEKKKKDQILSKRQR